MDLGRGGAGQGSNGEYQRGIVGKGNGDGARLFSLTRSQTKHGKIKQSNEPVVTESK